MGSPFFWVEMPPNPAVKNRIALIRSELAAERDGMNENAINLTQEPIESEPLEGPVAQRDPFMPPLGMRVYNHPVAPHVRRDPVIAKPDEGIAPQSMMKASKPKAIDGALEFILKNEGGFANHKEDAGGATNFGIAKNFHPEAWESGPPTKAEARRIYEEDYWKPIRGDDLAAIDPNIATAVMDTAVLFGVKRASQMLQRAVGASVDGVIGPQTLGMVRQADKRKVLESIARNRIFLHERRVDEKPDQGKFINGWINRARRVAKLGVGEE